MYSGFPCSCISRPEGAQFHQGWWSMLVSKFLLAVGKGTELINQTLYVVISISCNHHHHH